MFLTMMAFLFYIFFFSFFLTAPIFDE